MRRRLTPWRVGCRSGKKAPVPCLRAIKLNAQGAIADLSNFTEVTHPPARSLHRHSSLWLRLSRK